ncbi:hypothetical protein B0H16DRAFT_1474819 [Mycena metata]|uniref:Uncharacterized protein n=1 Tax=Mycena metata TaxID=1033252 RepID=A0AAD7HGL4_9AGAR|nr:hypothetical protein B0H16DRAFT_1474819 [Mycena metata]
MGVVNALLVVQLRSCQLRHSFTKDAIKMPSAPRGDRNLTSCDLEVGCRFKFCVVQCDDYKESRTAFKLYKGWGDLESLAVAEESGSGAGVLQREGRESTLFSRLQWQVERRVRRGGDEVERGGHEVSTHNHTAPTHESEPASEQDPPTRSQPPRETAQKISYEHCKPLSIYSVPWHAHTVRGILAMFTHTLLDTHAAHTLPRKGVENERQRARDTILRSV